MNNRGGLGVERLSNSFEPESRRTTEKVLFLVEGDIGEVVGRLEKAGVQVTGIIPDIDVVCGTIDTTLENEYRALDGVVDISSEYEVAALSE